MFKKIDHMKFKISSFLTMFNSKKHSSCHGLPFNLDSNFFGSQSRNLTSVLNARHVRYNLGRLYLCGLGVSS